MYNFLKYSLLIFSLISFAYDGSTQSCSATPSFIFNGSSQYNSQCSVCLLHNDNPPTFSENFCFDSNTGQAICGGSSSGYTGPGTQHDNNLSTNEFELTPDCRCQGGSLWNQIELDLKNDFSIEAELYFGNASGGADGIGFVLQTDPDGSTAVSQGGSMGYGNITPSFAVEFDTYYNDNSDDPSQDHIAIQRDGSADHDPTGSSNLLSPIALSVDLEDGHYRKVRFEWISDPDNDPNTSEGQFDVWFDLDHDGNFSTSEHLISNFSYDIIGEIFQAQNGVVYWGFTAATGAARNLHKVQNITPFIDVDFYYSSSSFCKNESNPSPTITGESGGTFSATPSTLVIDPNSGTIDLLNSAVGTFTIRYEIDATCFVEKVVTIEDNSSYFSYDLPIYCQSQNDPSPTFSSCLNGDFISSSGLVINSSTGQIDLDASLPGTYTISWMVSPELVEEHDRSFLPLPQTFYGLVYCVVD